MEFATRTPILEDRATQNALKEVGLDNHLNFLILGLFPSPIIHLDPFKIMAPTLGKLRQVYPGLVTRPKDKMLH